jgi:hypothetical protein
MSTMNCTYGDTIPLVEKLPVLVPCTPLYANTCSNRAHTPQLQTQVQIVPEH